MCIVGLDDSSLCTRVSKFRYLDGRLVEFQSCRLYATLVTRTYVALKIGDQSSLTIPVHDGADTIGLNLTEFKDL